MVRRFLSIATIGIVVMSMAGASADYPIPELGVLHPDAPSIQAGPCAAESVFDVAYGGTDADAFNETQAAAAHDTPAYASCRRLKVVFGPILAKPGQNDVLIQPVTFEKPMYDGYVVRFKPDLVGVDGNSPRVKDLHLHHGTWLNPGYFGGGSENIGPAPNPMRTYGRGPWIASGEEKTVAIWPEGFGLKVKATDAWLFLHMVHNATAETFPVWVTYDIDYIPAEAAEVPHPQFPERNEIANTEGIWLDVGDCSGWSAGGCQKDSFNPVFNIQRGFGTNGACEFPTQNCSMFNTLTDVSTQQGNDVGTVTDEITVHKDGTLVMMGGHVHNGGLADVVYLIRPQPGLDGIKGTGDDIVTDDDIKLIHISDAYYFDQTINWNNTDLDALAEDPEASKIGGAPTSWDFVMSGVTRDIGWSVNVERGDKIRLVGVYDTAIASWYEQMGIVMTWLVPTTNTGGEPIGVDVFDPSVTIDTGVNAEAVQPGLVAGAQIPGDTDPGPAVTTCTNSETTLCVRGQMTHPRIETSGDHSSCATDACQDIALAAPDGPVMTDIAMGGFGFGPAGFGVIGALGVPRVMVNEPVRFWNLDTADYMWHTVTRCALPCSGETSASYPLADGAWQDIAGLSQDTTVTKWGGATSPNIPAGSSVEEILALAGPDPMDFDSGQIGIGTGANQKLDWTWTPTRTGTFAFYCRIHPGMRGAVRVVDAA